MFTRKNRTVDVGAQYRAEVVEVKAKLGTALARLAESQHEIEKWKSRALRVQGAYKQLEADYDRVVGDNRELAAKLVDVLSRPPIVLTQPAAEKVDVTAIIESVRKIIMPEVVVGPRVDSEQATNWTMEGLDNNAGVPDTFDPTKDEKDGPSIPDYVLDVERMTEAQATGGRGGWYNPPTNS